MKTKKKKIKNGYSDHRKSISARERTRKTQFNNPQMMSWGPLNVQQNNLFKTSSRPVINVGLNEDEEDIDELINKFSEDLEIKSRERKER
jgi:hypothetical protein